MPMLLAFVLIFFSLPQLDPPACAGCVLQPFQTGAMGVTVTVTFGPQSISGTCTGVPGECVESPCKLQTLTYRITNSGWLPQTYTPYTGSFPILQAQTPETIGPGSPSDPVYIEKTVGKSTDPVYDFGCSGQAALVTQGLSTAGVECTRCQG